ncbi:FecCD transport family protein [Actinocrispum wychmicini]|uniref:FecCD transport family protein n=1 Tax=Actinocrispum wychmicini TaxID=1213861 RepID=A0A4R2K7L5_9PSEU|nr:FecCD transport family protein [Actinocrispum wychmicini]
MYFLAYRKGVAGYRLVLVGIGVAALLTALNRYLLLAAELDDAFRAAVWLTGSLLDRTWDHVTIVTVAVGTLVPAACLAARRLSLLEMGDDVGAALGVAPARTRLAVYVIAVGLAGAATAAAGPVAFVALAAPHITKRLSRVAGPNLVGSGLVGAILLLVADVSTQRFSRRASCQSGWPPPPLADCTWPCRSGGSGEAGMTRSRSASTAFAADGDPPSHQDTRGTSNTLPACTAGSRDVDLAEPEVVEGLPGRRQVGRNGRRSVQCRRRDERYAMFERHL